MRHLTAFKNLFIESYNQIYFGLLVCVELTLFLPIKYNSIVIITLCAARTIYAVLSREKIVLARAFWLPGGLFILFLISLSYSTNITQGLKELETRTAMLFIPMMIFSSKKITDDQRDKLLRYFGIASFGITLLLILWACWNYYQHVDIKYFYTEELTKIVSVNYLYLSYYIFFGFYCRFYIIRKTPYNPIIFWVVNSIGLIILFLLSSKTVLFIAIVGIVYMLLKIIHTNSTRIIALCLFAGVIISAFVFFSVTKGRFSNITNSSLSDISKERYAYNEPFNGLTLRLVFWKSSLTETIRDRNFFGVGIGSNNDYLNSIYVKIGLLEGGYKNFNVHNEYLETFLTLGVPGLLYLGFVLGYGLKKSFRENNAPFFLFLVIITVGSMTESVLTVNKGIVFFSFFYSVLYSSAALDQVALKLKE